MLELMQALAIVGGAVLLWVLVLSLSSIFFSAPTRSQRAARKSRR